MECLYSYDRDLENLRKGIELYNKADSQYGFILNIYGKDNGMIDYTITKLQEYLCDNKIKVYDDGDKIDDFNDLTKHKNNILVLDFNPINEFYNRKVATDWHRMDKINSVIRSLLRNNIIVICSPSSDIVLDFFEYEDKNYLDLLNHYDIYEDNYDDVDVVKIFKLFDENHIIYNLTMKDLKEVYDSCSNTYISSSDKVSYFYNYSVNKFINNGLVSKDSFKDFLNNNEVVKVTEEKKEIVTKDKKYVGLNNVKDELNTLFNYAKYIKDLNIDKSSTYLNMLFLGNPGTGKTMIADEVAKRLYELDYLKSPKVVRIVPNDLTGEYVGQTRNITRRVLDKAEGKLLFIDEAYLICQNSYKNGKNPFMEEAVVELLKYLEDPKHIVIFAGYKDELRKIYDYNPGFKSRIYKEILFEDYSNTELIKILSNDLKEKGLEIDNKAKKEIKSCLNTLKEDKNFGNARTIKKISQELIMNHANRKIKNDNKVIDITDVNNLKINNKDSKRMGFDIYDRR